MSRTLERRVWPGLDGWTVLVLSAIVVATWAIRGRAGPDLHIAVMLVLDAAYLGATWWSRR